jgi:glycosyltransferase involved in cell wall biosynthesis
MRDRACVVRHLDLSAPAPALQPDPEGRDVFAVFWWRSLPMGLKAFASAELPMAPAHLAALTADLAAQVLSARLETLGAGARLAADGRIQVGARLSRAEALVDPLGELDRLADEPPASASTLSVVICTRRRAEALGACLDALLAQKSPPHEILVVDNTEGDPATRAVAQGRKGVRYLVEPRRGLSAARNTGVLAARGALVAFTDDDVTPRPDWTGRLAAAFRPGVDAVTGLVLPARLDTEAQRLFQLELGGFGPNCLPMLFDRAFYDSHVREPVPVWRLGAGANMGFRKAVFDRIGLFDERLGAGRAGCSEDSEVWCRILAAGGTCLYEPHAVVFHDHRETMAELKAQMRAYIKGHVAALGVQHDLHGPRGNLRRALWHMPKHFLRQGIRALHAPSRARDAVVWAQFQGWLDGVRWLVTERGRPA